MAPTATANRAWTKSYTPTRKIATETSPTAAAAQTAYDGADRVSVVIDPDGPKVQTQYFKDGQTKKIVKEPTTPTRQAWCWHG